MREKKNKKKVENLIFFPQNANNENINNVAFCI